MIDFLKTEWGRGFVVDIDDGCNIAARVHTASQYSINYRLYYVVPILLHVQVGLDVMAVGVMVRVLAVVVLWHGYPVHLSPSPLHHHHHVIKASMTLPNSSIVSSTPKPLSATIEVTYIDEIKDNTHTHTQHFNQ